MENQAEKTSVSDHPHHASICLTYLLSIDGTLGKKAGGSGHYAPSNADEDDRQPGIRDKKFEGYSNLKGSHEMQQKRT